MQHPGSLGDGRSPVTLPPNHYGRAVETVGTVAFEIVDQCFVEEVLDRQFIGPLTMEKDFLSKALGRDR